MSSKLEDIIYESVRYLNLPFWTSTEYLLSQDTSWKGTGHKAVGVFATVISIPFAAAAETLHFAAQHYYQRSYLYFETQAEKKTGVFQKILNLNDCMFWGGLPGPFGGVTTANERMDRLAQLLLEQDADIICLQEMAHDASVKLIDKIKGHYRYFYYLIGPNPFRMESALFWASKLPLVKTPEFITYNVSGMQSGIKRGFFVAELENSYVIMTHLDPHPEKGEVRAQEIEMILAHMQNLSQKPIYLVGDLNLYPQDIKAQDLLKTHFVNFNEEAVKNPNEQNATCFDNLPEVMQGKEIDPRWSTPDHILVNDKSVNVVVKRIPTFDRNNLPAALSDHHAVLCELA